MKTIKSIMYAIFRGHIALAVTYWPGYFIFVYLFGFNDWGHTLVALNAILLAVIGMWGVSAGLED